MEIYHVHGISDNDLTIVVISPKLIYRFNSVPIKIQIKLDRTWQTDSKMYMNMERTQNIQNSFEKEQGGHTLPNDKTVLLWHKARQADQRDNAKEPDVSVRYMFMVSWFSAEMLGQ